jgi:amidase
LLDHEENKAKKKPGMSTFVNLLDYSSSVLPVTLVDKSIDVMDPAYKPLSTQDKEIYATCKFLLWAGRGALLMRI